MEEIKMSMEYNEYVTFSVTTKTGDTVEMAVVDEFDFENKHYVVGSLIKDDEIIEEGRYIYKCVMKEGDEEFKVEKIAREFEYNRIAEAYMSMED
jgi:hypothetical protein